MKETRKMLIMSTVLIAFIMIYIAVHCVKIRGFDIMSIAAFGTSSLGYAFAYLAYLNKREDHCEICSLNEYQR